MTPKAEVRPDPVDRRRFLQIGTLGMAALAEGAGRSPGGRGEDAPPTPRIRRPTSRFPRLVDVNVSLSHWPFRRLRWDETPALVGRAPTAQGHPGLGRKLRRAAAPRHGGREPPVERRSAASTVTVS